MLDGTPMRPTLGDPSEIFRRVPGATDAAMKAILRAPASLIQRHLQGTKTHLAPEQRVSSSVSSFSAIQLQLRQPPPLHFTGLQLLHREQSQDISIHMLRRISGEEAIAVVAVGVGRAVEGVDPSDRDRIVVRACIDPMAGQVRGARLQSAIHLLQCLKIMFPYDGSQYMNDNMPDEFFFSRHFQHLGKGLTCTDYSFPRYPEC